MLEELGSCERHGASVTWLVANLRASFVVDQVMVLTKGRPPPTSFSMSIFGKTALLKLTFTLNLIKAPSPSSLDYFAIHLP